ncbi:MAG: ParA family protein [Bacilli bacterium]|nr:ParA family protein [Bacilli bacterium]
MPRIIAVANQKGGVAKTTTAINISSSLVSFGKKVLLVDMDPQGNSSRGVGIDITLLGKSIYDVLTNDYDINRVIKKTPVEGLDVLPSNLKLANTESKVASKKGNHLVLLKKALAKIINDYDYIFIDCPPSVGLLNSNALTAAESVLIPVQCEYFAMEAVSQMLSTIRRIQGSTNKELGIEGIVFTMYDAKTRMSVDVTSEIRGLFKEKTYTTMIPRNISLPEAASKGMPVTMYKPSSQGATSYMSLAREFLDRELDMKL